jgi:hypothetical protein
MKNKILFGLLAAFGLCASANAQFDYFAAPRTIVLTYPSKLTATDSNSVIDIHGFEGVAKIDFICTTNNTTNAVTVQIMTSPDRTNWSALSSYALAVSNSIITTNNYYGTATPLATNVYLFAGTVTTPSAASSGFVTTYLNPAPFTNSGSITINTGAAEIGFVPTDAQRYLQAVWTFAGTSTNSVAAIFTGRKQQQ